MEFKNSLTIHRQIALLSSAAHNASAWISPTVDVGFLLFGSQQNFVMDNISWVTAIQRLVGKFIDELRGDGFLKCNKINSKNINKLP